MLGFFKENAAIQKMIATRYEVIFYAENAYYFQYFRHLFETLQGLRKKICYITSEKNDPVFLKKNPDTDVVFSKSTLGFAWPRLQADVVIMTMPDLDRFLFKKSTGVREYIYVFHALVSTHQQYRAHAFDAFDTILLAGPHQEPEIREAEHLYDLSTKNLIPYGYPLLEDLSAQATEMDAAGNILLAPSWYEEGILQTCLHELVEVLGASNFHLIIRPHPEFIKRNAASFRKLEKLSQKNKQIIIDTNADVSVNLLTAHWLITDRSGIAFEYAFVRNRPVLFIDTPSKVMNADLKNFSLIPAEDRFRENIGLRIQREAIRDLPVQMKQLESTLPAFRESINRAKAEMVYPNSHHQKAIDYILQQLG